MNDKAGHEVTYKLRYAIVTCRIIFGCTYFEIEQKIRVVSVTVRPIVVRTAGPTANIAGVPVIVE